MDPVDIEPELKRLKLEIPEDLKTLNGLRVNKEIKREFEARYNKLFSQGKGVYAKWKKLSVDLNEVIDRYTPKTKKSKDKPEAEKKSIEDLEKSLKDYYNRRLERLESEQNERNRKPGDEARKRIEERKRQEEKEREQIPVMPNEAGETIIRIKKLTRRRPVDKIKLINAPIIETWFNNVMIDPENPRELIEAERRSILEFTDYYQGVPIPETHQTRFIGAHDITSNNPQAIEPTRDEISEVVLSEIGEDVVKEQIKDMEKSGLLKGLLSLYANKPGAGPTSGSIVFEFADKLREEEKKDIKGLKDIESLEEIKGASPIVLNNLLSALGKIGKLTAQFLIPVGLGVGISSKLLKDNTASQKTNGLLTHQYYSNVVKPLTPPPLGEFGPPQGNIISRRGPALYLKPFANKEDMMNKQREEALRQRDIGIKKKYNVIL